MENKTIIKSNLKHVIEKVLIWPELFEGIGCQENEDEYALFFKHQDCDYVVMLHILRYEDEYWVLKNEDGIYLTLYRFNRWNPEGAIILRISKNKEKNKIVVTVEKNGTILYPIQTWLRKKLPDLYKFLFS